MDTQFILLMFYVHECIVRWHGRREQRHFIPADIFYICIALVRFVILTLCPVHMTHMYARITENVCSVAGYYVSQETTRC